MKAGNIVKFTNVISNNGQGYVTGGVNEGKFIPPHNGKKYKNDHPYFKFNQFLFSRLLKMKTMKR